MKRYTYTLSIISAGILTWLFLRRGSYLAAALAIGAVIFYGYGLIQDIRKGGKTGSAGLTGSGAEAATASGKAASEAALAELRVLYARYSKQMNIFRNASISLSLIAAMLGFINESLAIAVLVIALLALFKFWQNYRAVRLIKKGAGDRL